jgi:hypothetical protein
MRRSVVALITFLSGTLVGQPQTSGPITTSLCELAREPEGFNDKLVEIRSEFVSRFQWEGLVDETCSAKVQVGAHYFLGDLMAQHGQYAFTTNDGDNTHPERLTWRAIEPRLPVHLKQDNNYRTFRKYSDTKFRWLDGGRCQGCPLFRVTVTAIGRFDYFPSQNVAIRANPSEKAVGFTAGKPDLPLLWLVLESVSDVSTTPIDPSIYSEKKSRDVTLEEAHELVTAFLKDHAESRYGPGLEKYEVAEYPGFQFFQALPDPQSGRIHYGVDLKTGEVWDSPVCQNLTSPSLKKLQSAIRTRIGLTSKEVEKLRRRGPFCDP